MIGEPRSGNSVHSQMRGARSEKPSVIFLDPEACLAAGSTASCSRKSICPTIQMNAIHVIIELRDEYVGRVDLWWRCVSAH